MARAQDVIDRDGNAVRRKPVPGDLRWDGNAWRRWDGRRWRVAAYSLDPTRLVNPAPLHGTPPVSEQSRQRALALAVEEEVATNAGTVVLEGPNGVVVSYRRPVSHFLHAVLTVFTGGLWGVVWIAIALGRRDDRVRLEVDHWGNVWGRLVASR